MSEVPHVPVHTLMRGEVIFCDEADVYLHPGSKCYLQDGGCPVSMEPGTFARAAFGKPPFDAEISYCLMNCVVHARNGAVVIATNRCFIGVYNCADCFQMNDWVDDTWNRELGLHERPTRPLPPN